MPLTIHHCQRPANPSRHEQGFTLIEVLIVVAIIGILSAIAYPNYSQYVQDSRRADARLALLSEVQSLERCRSTNFSYASCSLSNAESPEKYYAITLENTASSYTVTATAQGAQSSDSDCSVMTIDQIGTLTPNSDSSRCWPN